MITVSLRGLLVTSSGFGGMQPPLFKVLELPGMSALGFLWFAEVRAITPYAFMSHLFSFSKRYSVERLIAKLPSRRRPRPGRRCTAHRNWA